MSEIQEGQKQLIIDLLKEKACTKQELYALMKDVFNDFKEELLNVVSYMKENVSQKDKRVEISYDEEGDFEVRIKFSGDILIFTLHSNIFTFDENHFTQSSNHVREDSKNAYFGMITVHNFLADSFKFSRMNDVGFMIGRIFINREKHFFVEGIRQLGFLFNDFDNMILNPVYLKQIVEASIIGALDFELQVPPFDVVRQISVIQKIQSSGNASFKTGKRLGFQFNANNNETV